MDAFHFAEEICISIEQVNSLLRMGDVNRQTRATNFNDRSSRSHSMYALQR